MKTGVKQFKRDERQNSNKLHLDKYYTSDETAQHCIDAARKVLKGERITEVIEPSAGNGVFSKKIKNCLAYDLEPEDVSVTKQDFFELDIEYKQGRLFIGNPPFGARNTLAVQFFKKCIILGDYVAFILPISQYNNVQQMYEFDLIYSEDLGEKQFTDRNIHCCFNIYKRPLSRKLNDKKKSKMEGIKIIESRLGKNRPEVYDYAICAWGSLGEQVSNDRHFAKEFYFVIDDAIKAKTIAKIQEANWSNEYNMTSVPNLLQWQVYDYLKKHA